MLLKKNLHERENCTEGKTVCRERQQRMEGNTTWRQETALKIETAWCWGVNISEGGDSLIFQCHIAGSQ